MANLRPSQTTLKGNMPCRRNIGFSIARIIMLSYASNFAILMSAELTDMKQKKAAAPVLPTIAKGQLWKTEKGHVEIMEVGKTLAHYRLFQQQKRVPTSLGRIQMVQDYLRDNQAKLVKNDRLAKTKA